MFFFMWVFTACYKSSYGFYKKKNRTVNLKNAHDKNCPITLSYHNFQLQALHVHCPISAQVRLVLTNHIQEFRYSFDYICNTTSSYD